MYISCYANSQDDNIFFKCGLDEYNMTELGELKARCLRVFATVVGLADIVGSP